MRQVNYINPKKKEEKKKGAKSINGVLKKGLISYFALLDGQPPARLHGMVMDEVEKTLLEYTMKTVGFNRSRAADMLGINRGTLRRKLERYKITDAPPPKRRR